MRKLIIIISILFAVALITDIVYFTSKQVNLNNVSSQKEQITGIKRAKCLDENEMASYKIEEKEGSLADVIVNINNKSTKRSSSFRIVNVFKTSTSIELHKCSIYVIREFNFDFKKYKPLPGFSVEIWKYQYGGEGEVLLLLAGENKSKEPEVYYSYDFRIDPNEKYLVLEKGYLGKDDYALVIKGLNTKQDVFTLLAKDITTQYPNIIGSFDMLEWSEDGRYFWGNVFDGAYVNGYFRIDASNWKVDIYEAPNGAMGGSKLNINTGYLPIQPGAVWTGDIEFDQINKEHLLKEGKKSELYLYNLFTKEKIFIVSTSDDPLWWFKPEWLSDTELRYELPNGEKKIYTIVE